MEKKMPRSYLKCFTLARSVPGKDRRDYLLACNREQALSLLALHLDTKQIMTPGQRLIPFRIPDSALSVSRPSNKDIASYLLRSGYLTLSRNPLIQQMESWLYEYQLLRHLRKREGALDEVVIKIFHSPGRYLPPGDGSGEPENGIILARLHFWEGADGQTILRVFIGWVDNASLEEQQALYDLLQGYGQLIEQATNRQFAETGGTKLLEESLAIEAAPRADSTKRPLAGQSSGQKSELAADKDGSNEPSCFPAAAQQSDALPKGDDGSFADSTELLFAEWPDRLPDQDGVAEFRDVSESQVSEWLPRSKPETSVKSLAPDEELYQLMEPPRIYGKTLARVCLMVAERQRQLDKFGTVKDINEVRQQVGPSKNTLLKLPELVTHWYDVNYRWNVETWLRCCSGHDQKEISERLSYLKYNLTEKVWAVVTQVGEAEEPLESFRHPAQVERDSRVKENAVQ
jgi:hypothetical protein